MAKSIVAQLEGKIKTCQSKIKKYSDGVIAEKNTLKDLQAQLKEAKKVSK